MKNVNFRHLFKQCVLGMTAFALVLTMAACATPGSTNQPTSQPNASATTAGTGKTKGGEVVNVVAGFNGFFAPKSQTTAMDVCWPCLETLGYQSADGKWNPRLATSWDIDSKAFTVTLHIKQGVKFSNGDTFDAKDVAWSLDVRNKYGTASNIGSPASITATDDYTVVVTYKSFSLDFLNWLLPQFMYSKETFDEKGENYMINNIIGTGPYVMKEYVPDDHLTFARDSNYWGTPGNPDTFTWRVIKDATAQVAAFMNGEIARILAGTPTTLKLLDTGAYTKLDAAGVAGMQYFVQPITLDAKSPLAVKEVRQAIYTYGIDFKAMADSLGGGTYFHTDAFGLTGNTYYKKELEFTKGPDYAKAKKLLADAGYPNGFSTKIFYGTGGQIPPGMDAIATYLQAELAKIGVTVECVPVDGTVLQNDYLKAGKAASSGLVVNGMYFTPLQTQRLNQMFNPKGTSGGVTAWSDKLVELYAKVGSAMTLEEQNKAMTDYVVQYVQVDSNYWPIFNARAIEFYQKWCHYSGNARIGNAGFDPREIWVDKH